MSFDAIIGGQWGDEGKGKIVDLLSKNVDVVARYQGGANAGHTVYLEDKKIVWKTQARVGSSYCFHCIGWPISTIELSVNKEIQIKIF